MGDYIANFNIQEMASNTLNSAIEYVKALPAQIPGMIQGAVDSVAPGMYETALGFYQNYSAICLIIGVCLLAYLAFDGYKIFKGLLYLGGAAAAAICGYMYLAPMVSESLVGVVPEFISVDALIAVVLGLLALILVRCAYNLVILLLGSAAGYFFGSMFIHGVIVTMFPTLGFLQADLAKYIMGGVFVPIFGILFILLFKHLFLILSSFGGAIGGSILLQMLVVPAANDEIKLAFVLFGAALGLIAVIRQYKEEERSMELVF